MTAAIDELERSLFARQYLGAEFVRIYAACKRQELETHAAEIPPSEHQAYLAVL